MYTKLLFNKRKIEKLQKLKEKEKDFDDFEIWKK